MELTSYSPTGDQKVKGNRNSIIDNRVEDAEVFGIHIGTTQLNCIIRGNTVLGCGSDGLYYCYFNSGMVVTGNIFTHNGGDGIGGLGDAGSAVIGDVQNITSNNICSYNGKCGIGITGGSGNVICGNVCYANSRSEKGAFPGIRINSKAVNTIVTGNVCTDDQPREMQKRGVEITDGQLSPTCIVKDNVSAGNVESD